MVEQALPDRVRGLASPDRIAQFVAVGTVGTAVDILLLWLLHGVLSMGLVPGKLIAAETSFLVMFVINERWTFADFGQATPRARIRRFARSNTVRIGGLITATVILVFLTETTGMWYMLANGIGIAVGFVVNYSAECLFTWRVHRD